MARVQPDPDAGMMGSSGAPVQPPPGSTTTEVPATPPTQSVPMIRYPDYANHGGYTQHPKNPKTLLGHH